MLALMSVDETHSIGWMMAGIQGRDDVPEQALYDFQKLIINQDVPIVESQRPELLPLDLQAELHLRSDRTAIAYRKWLKDLGVTFGVA
jgi:phenylpropionate dioxygenase-like ring-hydroxylating dioxygenase large terminal subunit